MQYTECKVLKSLDKADYRVVVLSCTKSDKDGKEVSSLTIEVYQDKEYGRWWFYASDGRAAPAELVRLIERYDETAARAERHRIFTEQFRPQWKEELDR